VDLSGFKEIVKDLTMGAEARALSKALKLYSKGQIDKAIEVLKEAHAGAPENSDILFELARLQTLANHGGAAAEALRTVLRRDPKAYQKANEMIEEIRAARGNVGPLYDAVADHFVRHDDLKGAFDALERMKADEIRSFMPRHRGKWDGLLKNAPDARMAKASLHSAYYLALAHEALRDFAAAAEIYRHVARTNPEETARVLKRLEALLARDYQNAALRVAVADLFLGTDRIAEAVQQFSLALETDPRAAAPITERVAAHLGEKGETPELRWLLVSALLRGGDQAAALQAMHPLLEAGALLDQVVAALQPLSAGDKGRPARRLLATAYERRGQPQAALETLLLLAEEEGLPSIGAELQALAEAHPDLPRVHHLLADIHLAEGGAAQAVASMRRARELAPGEETVLVPKLIRLLQADPAAADAHLFLADLLMKSGEPLDLRRAVVLLRHLVRVAPAAGGEAAERLAALIRGREEQAPRARLGAAEACLAAGRFPEALQHLQGLASSQAAMTADFLPTVVDLAEASPEQSPAVCDLLRALEPRSPLPHAVRFALALAAYHGGDISVSVAALQTVLEAAPERTGEVLQALERFDRDDPRATEARYLLASIYLDRRDYAAADAELARGGAVNTALLERVLGKYEAILQATPDEAAARLGYIQALLLGRQYDRVLAFGQETLKQREDETTVRITLAMGDALRDKGEHDSAAKRYFAAYGRDRSLAGEVVSRLRDLVQAEGTQALASLALGKVLGAEGRASEAVEALRAAGAADPKLQETVHTELQNLMSTCPADPQPGLALLAYLKEAHDTQRALQVISGLLDAHPQLAGALVTHIESILEAEPNLGFAQYELGRALQRMQMVPRSAASFLTAFRQDAGLAPMVLKRLQELILLSPGSPEPYLVTCAIHASRGKLTAAAETIQKALMRIPAEADRLVPRLEEIWKQHRGNPQIAMAFAEVCRRAGHHDKAILAYGDAAGKDSALFDAAFEGFEAIVAERPEMGEAYLARGRAHAQRLRIEPALADLEKACQLEPRLLPAALQQAEALRGRMPESYPCLILVADLCAAAGRDADARRLLEDELQRGWSATERLSILVRLWRLAAAAHDDEKARAHLEEATHLAPERGPFLARVHEAHVAALRAEAAQLRERLRQGSRRASDLQMGVRALVDLGAADEARLLLERHASIAAPEEVTRLRGEIALRQGDYPRATEFLATLGPSRALAFGAERAGDFALSARILETLAGESADTGLRVALSRVYKELVAAELLGGGQRLQAETVLSFGEGAAE
jgi:tetratricopeptide (TPR) repeat protein